MAKYLPLLTLFTPAIGFDDCTWKRIFGGHGYGSHSPVPHENYRKCRMDTTDSLYNYYSEDIEKKNNISMREYEGKVTLIVNVASF